MDTYLTTTVSPESQVHVTLKPYVFLALEHTKTLGSLLRSAYREAA